MDQRLKKYRQEIDKIDEKLLELLSSRIELADKIGIIKRQQNIPIKDPEREKSVLIKTHGVNLEYRQQIKRIFKQIIEECSLIQQKERKGR